MGNALRKPGSDVGILADEGREAAPGSRQLFHVLDFRWRDVASRVDVDPGIAVEHHLHEIDTDFEGGYSGLSTQIFVELHLDLSCSAILRRPVAKRYGQPSQANPVER